MPDLALPHLVQRPRKGSPPYPGLLLLHGLGSNEHDLMAMAPAFDPGLVAVSARAPFSYQWGGYAWYDLDQHGPGLGSESIESSLEILSGFLGEIVREYEIEPSRLYVGGFSMGAAMAGAVALLEPDRVAGAIMASGYLPPDTDGRYRTQEAAGLPFFQAHGTLDPVVSLETAHLTRDFLRATPVDLTYREYPIGHTVSLDELQDLSVWLAGLVRRSDTRVAG